MNSHVLYALENNQFFFSIEPYFAPFAIGFSAQHGVKHSARVRKAVATEQITLWFNKAVETSNARAACGPANNHLSIL